jgi:hypothetical protein
MALFNSVRQDRGPRQNESQWSTSVWLKMSCPYSPAEGTCLAMHLRIHKKVSYRLLKKYGKNLNDVKTNKNIQKSRKWSKEQPE